MTTTVESVLKFIGDVLRGEDESHSLMPRIAAAFWGCSVFHMSLLLYKSAHREIPPELIDEFVFIGPGLFSFYALVFSLIVAAGIPRGSLVRHFVYGALLPAFAYMMARFM